MTPCRNSRVSFFRDVSFTYGFPSLNLAITSRSESSASALCPGIGKDSQRPETCVFMTIAPTFVSETADPTRTECPEMEPSMSALAALS